MVGRLTPRDSPTRSLRLHGYVDTPPESLIDAYGSDRSLLESTIAEDKSYAETLAIGLPYLKGEVIYAVRHEMARTVDDVLSRRTRSLLLDARAARDAAAETARLMATELGKSAEWEAEEAARFRRIADRYVV
jgi:glycerol-3-phosphate dehydrogenase